jgi:uncharacterized protein
MVILRQCILVLVVLIAGLFVVGCGKKTPPVPPDVAIPVAVKDLKYTHTLGNVSLAWSCPKESVAGMALDTIGYFMLYQSKMPEDEYCSGCPVDFVSTLKIDSNFLSSDEKIKIQLSDFLPGYHYSFMVKAHSGWNIVSEESNKVSFWWDHPASEPAGLKLKVGDGQFQLSWHPVSTYTGGEPLSLPVFYQVYKGRTEGKEFSALGSPVKETRFVDSEVQNGREYFYQVQALHVYNDSMIPGGFSKIISAIPSDITPPSPPDLLSVVLVSNGVKILWDSVSAIDLAGYKIYRRTDETSWIVIGETSAGAFSYVDEKILEGEGVWHYSVTSFDRAFPPNESSFSRQLSITK